MNFMPSYATMVQSVIGLDIPFRLHNSIGSHDFSHIVITLRRWRHISRGITYTAGAVLDALHLRAAQFGVGDLWWEFLNVALVSLCLFFVLGCGCRVFLKYEVTTLRISRTFQWSSRKKRKRSIWYLDLLPVREGQHIIFRLHRNTFKTL